MLATNFSKISMDANPEVALIHPSMSVMFFYKRSIIGKVEKLIKAKANFKNNSNKGSSLLG